MSGPNLRRATLCSGLIAEQRLRQRAVEAKCLARNNNAKIEEAHQKLSLGTLRPSGVRELINLLSEYDTPEAQAWREALLKLWSGGYQVAVRHDGVAYVCGHLPQRGERRAWLPIDAPH